MEAPTSLGDLAQFFRLFDGQNRLKIFSYLMRANGTESVGQVATGLKMNQTAVAQHLIILSRGGYVENRRSGKKAYYTVNREKFSRHLICLRCLLVNREMSKGWLKIKDETDS